MTEIASDFRRDTNGSKTDHVSRRMSGHFRPRRKNRRGKIAGRLALGLVVALLGSLGAWRVMSGRSGASSKDGPITVPVSQGPFVHEIVGRGSVGSASNIEVTCQVQSRGNNGTTILEIVPEGTYAKKGDFLVKLDDSILQIELLQQEIIYSNSEAEVIESEATLQDAKLALNEYQEGTFKQEHEQLESELFVAKENQRRADEYLRYSKKLAERGYVSEVQLEADRFAVEKAKKELLVAETKLKVLSEFTLEKMLNKLRTDIKTSQARLKSRQNSYNLDMARLKKIKDQIAKCTILAPAAGQVVYANDENNRNSSGDWQIAEGRQVRERQVIIRLPNPEKMQVVTKVNESRIDHVKEGMTATITLDAFPAAGLTGIVRKVNEYPVRQQRWKEHIKEYETTIEIVNSSEGLRSGMNAEVAIKIEQLDAALQVPPQAIFGRNDQYYCLVAADTETLQARAVKVGAANEKYVVIENGLQVGEKVLLSPENYTDEVDLPTDKDSSQTASNSQRANENDAALVKKTSHKKSKRQ